MKSTVLSLAMALMATATASAETFDISYCDDALVDYWGNVTAMGVAIEVPAEDAASMVGYKVVGMQVGVGDGVVQLVPFVAHKFGADVDRAFLTKKPISGSKLKTQEWNEITFDNPYTITGERFFVGYYLSGILSKKLPIASDGSFTPSTYNWAGWGSSVTDIYNTMAVRNDMGNFSIRLIVEGESLPADRVTLRDVRMPILVSPGESFNLYADLNNTGYNEITSVSGSVTLGDNEPVPFDIQLEAAMQHNDKVTITISDLSYEHGGINIPAVVSVDKVNGVDNLAAVKTLTTEFNCSNSGFERNIVVEEGSGTWCGNCVYGIAGMRHMEETYTDGSFIPLVVHVTDAMTCSDYAHYANEHFTSVPSATVSRMEDIYPNRSSLVESYLKYHQLVYSRVTLQAAYTNESRSQLQIVATSEFGADHNDIDYALGFILSEDNVGPYAQTNYASGTNVDAGGFEDLSDPTYMMYNDVVRAADGVYGLADSAITSAYAGEKVDYEHMMSTRSVGNVDNMKVTVIQIDRKTGAIVNGAQIKAADISDKPLGIIVTEADNAPVEYYNLQGVRIDKPTAAGVYVRRQGGVSDKVVVR